MLTITDISPCLVRAGLDDKQAAARLRRWHGEGIIKPIARAGSKEKSPWLYGPEAMPLAKLISFLWDMGFHDSDLLKRLWANSTEQERPGESMRIVEVLKQIAEGNKAYLIVASFIRPSDGDMRLSAYYRFEDESDQPIVCPTDDHEPVADLVVNLDFLLGQFIEPREPRQQVN